MILQKRHYLVYILWGFGAIASIFLGYFLSLYNTVLDTVAQEFRLCGKAQKTLTHYVFASTCDELHSFRSRINGIYSITAAFGTLMAGMLMNWLGRRITLMLIFFVITITQYLTMFADSVSKLYFLRGLDGLAAGLATIIPAVYMVEMAPKHLKAYASLIPSIAGAFGIILGIVPGLSMKVPQLDQATNQVFISIPEFHHNHILYRILLFLPCPIAGSCFLLLFHPYNFETPTYLRSIQQYELANEIETVLSPQSLSGHAKLREEDTEKSVKPINLYDPLGFYCSRLSRWIRPGLAQCHSCVNQLMIRYFPLAGQTFVTGWTLASLQQLSGINVFLALSNAIFVKLGVPPEDCVLGSLVMSVLSLLCFAISPAFLVHSRRKYVILRGFLLMALAHSGIAVLAHFHTDHIAHSLLLLTFTFLFIIVYGCTLGPILFLYLNELFDPAHKDFALAVSFFLNWAASFATMYIFNFFTNEAIKFWILAITCFFGALYTQEFAIETLHNNHSTLSPKAPTIQLSNA